MNWLEYHEEPVTLHSSGKSHWLVRGDLIFQDMHLRAEVLDYWLVVLRGWRPPFEILSVPTGGDSWAAALRTIVPTSEEPVMAYRVVVDDVVTTGASILADPSAHARLAVVDRRIGLQRRYPNVNAWMHVNLPLL